MHACDEGVNLNPDAASLSVILEGREYLSVSVSVKGEQLVLYVCSK